MRGPDLAIMMVCIVTLGISTAIAFVRFFVVRARHIERKAMIERGIDLSEENRFSAEARLMSRMVWLRAAYAIIGLAIGVVGGGIINAVIDIFSRPDIFLPTPVTILVCGMICMGLGIILFYRQESSMTEEPHYEEPVPHHEF